MRTINIANGKKIGLSAGLGLLLISFATSLFFLKSHYSKAADNSVKLESKGNKRDLLALKHRTAYSAMSQIPSLKKRFNGEKGESPQQSHTSQVESILMDKSLSFEETATRLLECVRREDLEMDVRLAALDHAFNLDHWQALILCMEKPLPSPIARRLLSGIHNLNESPKDQAAACLYLIQHEDAEIREQAQKLLAFLVSAEEYESDPNRLREAANVFLNQADNVEKIPETSVETQ